MALYPVPAPCLYPSVASIHKPTLFETRVAKRAQSHWTALLPWHYNDALTEEGQAQASLEKGGLQFACRLGPRELGTIEHVA